MDVPTPPLSRRTLRTYAKREDADQAKSVLVDQGIAAEVEEHFITPPGGQRISKGCTLTVPGHLGPDAARVLLKMPPSETAGKPEPVKEPLARSPMRRRIGPPRRQKSSIPIILMAVLSSSLGLYWLVRQALRGKMPTAAANLEEFPENVLIREDINWDGDPDVVREYTPNGQLLSMLEDRDFDGKMDLRWIWQRNELVYRDRDIDRDGTMDERTVFDAYNEPFYVDLREQGKGPVIRRRIYREGVLWKILDDADADTHFDRIQEFSPDGVIFRDEALPKGSPENGVPKAEALPQGTVKESALPLTPTPPRP